MDSIPAGGLAQLVHLFGRQVKSSGQALEIGPFGLVREGVELDFHQVEIDVSTGSGGGVDFPGRAGRAAVANIFGKIAGAIFRSSGESFPERAMVSSA